MGYFDNFNKQQSSGDEEQRTRGNLNELVGKTTTFTRVNRCKSAYSADAFVFEIADDVEHYYFGNSPLNKVFAAAEKDGMLGEIDKVAVTFETRKSEKYNREYIVPVFGDEIPF